MGGAGIRGPGHKNAGMLNLTVIRILTLPRSAPLRRAATMCRAVSPEPCRWYMQVMLLDLQHTMVSSNARVVFMPTC